MRTKKRRALWAPIGALLFLLGLLLVVAVQQIHQDSLDAALIQAARSLDAPAVARLLDRGANANARDTGEPPLTIPGLLNRLLQRIQGGPVPPGSGRSVLHLLLKDKRFSTSLSKSQIRLFKEHGIVTDNPRSQLAPTIDAIAAALVRRGADFDIRLKDNKTPLHAAALHGMHETVRLLAATGAAVNVTDAFGMTPLMYADAQDAAVLLQHGADINARNTRGETALAYTMYRAVPAHIKLLLEHGANVNAANVAGNSPLYLATITLEESPNKAAILRLLRQSGARLTRNDSAGLKRLHLNVPQ